MTRRRPTRRGAGLLWLPLLLVNVPLGVAVAVGLMAAYLPSGPFWWAQLVAVWLPHLTWVLALAAAFPLLAGRWGLFALHVLAIGLVVGRVEPRARLAPPPPPAPDDLRLLTFNVPEDLLEGNALGDSVVALLREEAPHLLALQDVYVRAGEVPAPAVQVRAPTEALPYTLALPGRLLRRPGWKDRTTGVPLLVRPDSVRVLEQEALRLGTRDDGQNSMALRTRFEWQGREAVLYNVHLRSFGAEKPWWDDSLRFTRPETWLPYLRRYRRVYHLRGEEVGQLRAAMQAETAPVLLVGDFNSTADNHTYRRLRGDLQDAFRMAGGWRWGRTYHALQPFVRIDFVLVDPAFEVVSARVRPVRFSDHRPVAVRLRWRDPPPDAPPG
ncbi:MAG: endonuclease/exonuclease/phosphatase family protein [Rubricoccaceae bacterium]